eukprot:UN34012
MGDQTDKTSRHTLAPQYGCGFSLSDLIVSIMSSYNRFGFREVILSVPNGCAFTPVKKYVLMTNPWIQKLDVIYTNQCSDRLDSEWDGAASIEDYDIIRGALIKLVCNSILDETHARVVSLWPFVGIYPFATSENKTLTVSGVNFSGGSCLTREAYLTSICHVNMLQNNICRSEIGRYGIGNEYLQYWNAWHWGTGEVELNVRKDFRLET